MARRKRVLDDGDDSDSEGDSENVDLDFENDPDAREERALFENPYRHKRRRKNGKEDALYGIFADDSDEDTNGRRLSATAKRRDWAKAPAFISSDKPITSTTDSMDVDLEAEVDPNTELEEDGEDGSDEAGGEETGSEGEEDDPGSSNESEPSRAPSPRVRIEEEEEEDSPPKPRIGGIGFSSSTSSHAGIGSKSSSNSFQDQNDNVQDLGTPTPSLPSSFAQRTQSFVRTANASPKPVALPASEMAHFSKIQGSFGARMLAKMGWQAGAGLGVGGEGIVIPIESKLRPQKMGIAFKGFKEKTEQSKLEAKRRGDVVSDEEDARTKKFKKKAKEQQEKRAEVWKRPKRVRFQVEHKTYEQILAETGEEAPQGIGQIIDATGAVPREVASLADISKNNWAPSNDPTRIPEVRHNIRLIADACKGDLDGLAREAKALHERKRFVLAEDARLRQRVEDEAMLIAKLQQIQLVANDIQNIAKELASLYEVSLEPLSDPIQKLINEYPSEYEKFGLDEIVVGAITPTIRRMTSKWNPLEEPSLFLSTFKSWRRALNFKEDESVVDREVDLYGTKRVLTKPVEAERHMTPFESLLWNIWLPKVRTSINNEWSAEEPHQAVKLYELWSAFLPPFIRDNLLDQLILPKVHKAVADWNTKQSKVSLRTIVFPWLPFVGIRMEEVVGDARRKIRNVLRNWSIDEAIPNDLIAWKDVFEAGEWDAMLLKYVVPKLGAAMRNDFRVNPRDQKMETLLNVFSWSNIIRSSIFSQIIETEFFPKWLDVLHIWLIQPKVSFEEVAQWYSFWKGTFPETIRNLPGISRGFTRGLQLMNKAIELGPEAPTKLKKPDFLGEISTPSSPRHKGKDTDKITKPSARTHEITFRSIVEDFAATHNLLFIPTGKAHEHSRMPLFRVSKTADGRKGLLVYVLDDAVWAPKTDGPNVEAEEFKAISLEDMVLRAH